MLASLIQSVHVPIPKSTQHSQLFQHSPSKEELIIHSSRYPVLVRSPPELHTSRLHFPLSTIHQAKHSAASREEEEEEIKREAEATKPFYASLEACPRSSQRRIQSASTKVREEEFSS